MTLYETQGRKLDKFIFDILQPSEEFLGQVRAAIRDICEFLRENCFRDSPQSGTKVLKVVKGGSSGKGTALKGGSDADLVLFLNIFKCYEDQKKVRKPIIEEIERRLKECTAKKEIKVLIEQNQWPNPRVLSFKFCSKDLKENIEFDILPAFDALGQNNRSKPNPQVYIDLIDSSCDGPGGQFSPCFTELQRDFIIDRPTKVKSLIRLVKHWYKEYVYPHKSELRAGESLPPKYAMELLAIYTWEQGSQKSDFDMVEGFQTFLWLIQQYRDLCIFWTKYYDFENVTLKQYLLAQLQKPRPVILDPADPTGILGEKSRWDLLAKEAEYCSAQICCMKDGFPVAPWIVPVKVSLPMSNTTFHSSPGVLQLNVRLQTQELYSLTTHASKTVWEFKVQVGQKTGVPPYQQKLACQNNGHTNLRDGAQLSEFGLSSGDTIQLTVVSEESIPIFLHNAKGQTRTYHVLPSDSVAHFRAQVQQQEKVQKDQFWLAYGGRSLEDDHKLSDYDIAPCCTIILNLLLRGGCNLVLGSA